MADAHNIDPYRETPECRVTLQLQRYRNVIARYEVALRKISDGQPRTIFCPLCHGSPEKGEYGPPYLHRSWCPVEIAREALG